MHSFRRALSLPVLLLVAVTCLVGPAFSAERSDPSAVLADAQRRLRLADDQLDRAQRNATGAQRSLRQAEEDLEEAQRNVERKRARIDEARKAAGEADEKLAEAQRKREAARAAIEKLYESQQR